MRVFRVCALSLILAFLAVGPSSFAESEAVASEAAEREKERAEARAADLAEAAAELKRSSDFLAAQKRFRLEAHIGFDVVQSTGQKLEFGGTREVTVRRPDRARVVSRARDGRETTLVFDGDSIFIDLPQQSAYVSVKKPGTLDAALDYLVDDLGTPAPLADLMYSEFHSGIADRIVSGFIVGESMIGKCDCLHLAFSTEDIDAQLWIEADDSPLPYRLVITYKHAEGSPQFWAQFSKWDLSPDTPDSLFAFKVPEGAEMLPISVAVQNAQQAMEGE